MQKLRVRMQTTFCCSRSDRDVQRFLPAAWRRCVAPLRVAVKLANPEYPENARRNVADNKGVLAFLVGSGGSAYMPSFHLTRTDFADFEAPMRTAVAESMVAAARSGGRRVSQLVTQPFQCSVRPATPWLRSYRSLRATPSANRAVRHHTRE